MGSIAHMDFPQNVVCRDVSWPSPPTPSSKLFFQSDRPEPPSPLKTFKCNTSYLEECCIMGLF